jgi:calcium binding protein 39
VALNCGAMLRECIRYEALTKILLNSDNLFDFFKYVEVSTFDIASDAFATFKVNLQELVLWNRDFKMPQNSTLLRSDVPALWLGGI